MFIKAPKIKQTVKENKNMSFALLEDDTTQLCCAVQSASISDVRMLIEKAKDLNSRNKSGETALHVAVCSGQQDVVHELLHVGANVNSRNQNGQTPLHLAASAGEDEIVRLLIAANANINCKTKYREMTALHLASMNGHTEVVRELLQPTADIQAKDVINKTADFYAANKDIADLLGQERLLQGFARKTSTTVAEKLQENNSNFHATTVNTKAKPETMKLESDKTTCFPDMGYSIEYDLQKYIDSVEEVDNFQSKAAGKSVNMKAETLADKVDTATKLRPAGYSALLTTKNDSNKPVRSAKLYPASQSAKKTMEIRVNESTTTTKVNLVPHESADAQANRVNNKTEPSKVVSYPVKPFLDTRSLPANSKPDDGSRGKIQGQKNELQTPPTLTPLERQGTFVRLPAKLAAKAVPTQVIPNTKTSASNKGTHKSASSLGQQGKTTTVQWSAANSKEILINKTWVNTKDRTSRLKKTIQTNTPTRSVPSKPKFSDEHEKRMQLNVFDRLTQQDGRKKQAVKPK